MFSSGGWEEKDDDHHPFEKIINKDRTIRMEEGMVGDGKGGRIWNGSIDIECIE